MVFCGRRGRGAGGAQSPSPPWPPSGPRSGAGRGRAQSLTTGTLIIRPEQSFPEKFWLCQHWAEEDFHLDPAPDQCQKMTNFKLTLLSLFLKQINHYNNIYRRVSKLIRCREIKVGWFSDFLSLSLQSVAAGAENNFPVLRFNQSFGRSQVMSCALRLLWSNISQWD